MKTLLIFTIAAVIIIVVYSIVITVKKKKVLKQLGFNPKDAIKTGKYTIGHPDLDKTEAITEVFIKDGLLNIFTTDKNGKTVLKANIPCSNIKNVIIEDASTMKHRVTVGRLLTIGVFAFAAKKNKKREMSYLIIEWSDGRFDHETIFEFSGAGAIEDGNTARNKIIKQIR